MKNMGRKAEYGVSKHLPLDRLEGAIKEKRTASRVLTRLNFIRAVYNGAGIEDASKKAGITKATGYNWLHRWNEDGYEGLIPQFAGGRPSRIKAAQIDDLELIVQKKSRWTVVDIVETIKKRYDVDYSTNQARRIMRRLGLRGERPRSRYYR